MKTFITSDGKKVKGKQLKTALGKVADFWVSNAKAVRVEDAYADHITEETKETCLQQQLEQAERIRQGIEPMGFWLWQRVNQELTGKCVAFFAEGK